MNLKVKVLYFWVISTLTLSLCFFLFNRAEGYQDYAGDVYPHVFVLKNGFRVIFENNVEKKYFLTEYDFSGKIITGKQRVRVENKIKTIKSEWKWPHTETAWGVYTPLINSEFSIIASQNGTFSLEVSSKLVPLKISNRGLRENNLFLVDALLNKRFLSCLFFQNKKLLLFIFDPDSGKELFRETVGMPLYADGLYPFSSNLVDSQNKIIIAWVDKKDNLKLSIWGPNSGMERRVLLHGIRFCNGLSMGVHENNLLVAWHQMDVSVKHSVIRTILEKIR